MKKQILEELREMRYLFNYDRGKIISEQNQNLNEMIDLEKGSFGYDLEEDAFGTYEDELEEDMDDVDMDTRTPEERERDMLDIDMDTRTPEERERNMGDRHMDTGEDLAPSFDSDGNFLGMVKPNRDGMEVDGDLIENRELEVPVKPGTKTPTKPDKDSPYKPKPGPKKKPKAKKGDMPDWLSFDELGINLKRK
jgi:hypothetical protein